jgi:hypothetical protein
VDEARGRSDWLEDVRRSLGDLPERIAQALRDNPPVVVAQPVPDVAQKGGPGVAAPSAQTPPDAAGAALDLGHALGGPFARMAAQIERFIKIGAAAGKLIGALTPEAAPEATPGVAGLREGWDAKAAAAPLYELSAPLPEVAASAVPAAPPADPWAGLPFSKAEFEASRRQDAEAEIPAAAPWEAAMPGPEVPERDARGYPTGRTAPPPLAPPAGGPGELKSDLDPITKALGMGSALREVNAPADALPYFGNAPEEAAAPEGEPFSLTGAGGAGLAEEIRELSGTVKELAGAVKDLGGDEEEAEVTAAAGMRESGRGLDALASSEKDTGEEASKNRVMDDLGHVLAVVGKSGG